MDVKVSSKTEPDPQLEPHHIYLRSGQVVSVMAYRFRVHLNKQTISFYNSETDRNKKVFWQLPEVTGVVASSALAELPPLVKVQNQVEALTARVDAFENSLGEIVKRAVREALSSET
jgi:hypothetical protein